MSMYILVIEYPTISPSVYHYTSYAGLTTAYDELKRLNHKITGYQFVNGHFTEILTSR
jgi:hypothetical protein